MTPPLLLHALWPGNPGQGYCGRRRQIKYLTDDLTAVTCADCLAAMRADRVRVGNRRVH